MIQTTYLLTTCDCINTNIINTVFKEKKTDFLFFVILILTMFHNKVNFSIEQTC